MRKHLNSEGYTLITVLLIIVIISMFALTLIPKALSTAVQVNKGEEMSQTKDLAEMGVSYTHALLQSTIEKAINDTKNDSTYSTSNHNDLFCNKLSTRLNQISYLKPTPTKEVLTVTNPNFSYEIVRAGQLKYTSSGSSKCDGFVELTIPITSIGQVGNELNKELYAEFTIRNKGNAVIERPGNGMQPDHPSTLPLQLINNHYIMSGQSGSREFVSSPHFKKGVELRGNSMLSVGGHAWIEGNPNDRNNHSIFVRGGSATVVISGNLYLEGNVASNNGSPVYICARGIIYKKVNNSWVEMSDTEITNYCPRHIWEEVEKDFFYDINDWMVMDIDVTY